MTDKIKVLAFAGSLRAGSYNKALIRAAVEVAPPIMAIETYDLEGIPLYNADLESNLPPKVREFKEKVRVADALLIATPEYNYSLSGVLKNALDWASRPPKGNPLEGKPVAIMSASGGKFGGARAQYHLRQVFVFLDMHPINRPEVMLSDASNNVDEKGNLTNPQTRQLISQLLESLVAWTTRLQIKPQRQ
ncbi:MAG: NAD(P)H-dependent oxidoreductase [Nitrososphaerota archaeon]|uniref:NADPH-dependent FMN reductase n=1 Tax=Candidatus Bathycorpusculum sp. TaxID=2994959 RepID=UPI00282B86CE|nr:NAD(P)H-dependent oxidoreductase [Candidatus Termitimicrobium sp.]MCL2431395.1 NAD(P)H-dependent oxidoreductase [Candidatus Termitimicrobium sp.]MDR0493984.1 NAD(P)H-dependent oxidoreductase [Nitrososphaerota archaeon]